MRASRVLVEKIACIWPVFCQFNERKSTDPFVYRSRVLPQSPSLALPEGREWQTHMWRVLMVLV